MTFITCLIEEYEHQTRHRIAQYNASLPIANGGLGLHPQNTPMERARALGYDIDMKMFHGTGHDLTHFKDGIYTTNNPNYGYIKNSNKVYPVYIKRNNPLVTNHLSKLEMARSNTDEIHNEMNAGNHDSLEYRKPHDPYKGASGWGDDYPQFYSHKGSSVRSVNAAFDPFKRESNEILA